MKNYFPVLSLVLLGTLSLVWLETRANSLANLAQQVDLIQSAPTTKVGCIPTFVDGGGPYYFPNSPFRAEIAPTNHQGEVLTVTGKVLMNDCVTPLADVLVDVWQANESGNYEDEWYRGQVKTTATGEYGFTTVIPKGYGEGTAFRPPHIHFKIWQNNQELITSQMFLPASRAQGIEEAYIIRITSKTENDKPVHSGYHDLIMP